MDPRFLDSFTHSDGWIVGHLSILQMPVFIFAGRTARVCHVLWYASSFAGAGGFWWRLRNGNGAMSQEWDELRSGAG
jgi:hypothetical protein